MLGAINVYGAGGRKYETIFATTRSNRVQASLKA